MARPPKAVIAEFEFFGFHTAGYGYSYAEAESRGQELVLEQKLAN